MSADIVNLRRARKAKARAVREEKGAENRARFGQTRAGRETDTRLRDLAERKLDGHRLQPDDDDAR